MSQGLKKIVVLVGITIEGSISPRLAGESVTFEGINQRAGLADR